MVVGASGSGKTSLLRSVIGLIPHFYEGEARGDVVVMGESVAESSIGELARRVGYVFQDPENQILASSAGADVALSLESRGVPPEEARRVAREVLRQLGSEDLYDAPIHALSSGQRQRVAIAGEIARSPDVLLLDEPSSMLDPRAAAELMVLLRDLVRRRGLTVVLVEHRLEPALPFADRLVLLRGGSVGAAGDPRELLGDWGSVAMLKSAGVSVPAAVQVYHLLRFMGMDAGRGMAPLSFGELMERLRGGGSGADEGWKGLGSGGVRPRVARVPRWEPRPRGRVPVDPGGRGRGAGGAQRVGEDDPAEAHQWAAQADEGHGEGRRAGH
ncbi:MAG: ABC transporter ATP-binding protein [Nitrososphaeria archaeon]